MKFLTDEVLVDCSQNCQSINGGIRKAIHCAREECHTDSHSYGNRRHVFREFTDDECEIPDMLLCVKRQFNAQEETLALSGTQRHQGGLLCTNKLHQTACFGYIFSGWWDLYVAKS